MTEQDFEIISRILLKDFNEHDSDVLIDSLYKIVLKSNGNGEATIPSNTVLERVHEIIVYCSRYHAVRKLICDLKDGPETISEKVYCLVNDVGLEPCPHGSFMKFGPPRRDRGQKAGYRIFCSKQCICARESRATNMSLTQQAYSQDTKNAIRIKRQKTTFENHGVTEFLSLPDAHQKKNNLYPKGSDASAKIYEKTIKTHAEKHGGMGLASKKIANKARNTRIKRFGTEYASQNPEVAKKISLSNITAGKEAAEKRRAHYNDRFGVDSYFQTEEGLKHLKQQQFDKWGSYYYETEDFKFKSKETNRIRYSVGNWKQSHIPPESLLIINDKSKLQVLIDSHTTVEISEKLGVSRSAISAYCRKHDIAIPRSSYEKAVGFFLTSLGLSFKTNTQTVITRDGIDLELDFYLPDHKIAIEFNGLYWHSSAHERIDKHFHRRKYEACRDAGIRLMMINQDEWDERSDVVKSRMRNILGMSDRGKGARKLTLSSIDTTRANHFFAQYHLQGSTGSLIAAYGAFDGDDLVAALGYNRQRGTHAVELIRYATDGKIYPGIFSRLFKYNQDYDEVISFADLRYSQGNLYEKNGFELTGKIRPDYRYIIGAKTYHKSSFTKKKIAKKYCVDVTGKTERQLMEELGIPHIYDCGKLCYVWKRKGIG